MSLVLKSAFAAAIVLSAFGAGASSASAMPLGFEHGAQVSGAHVEEARVVCGRYRCFRVVPRWRRPHRRHWY
jgi:hypothetical protein